ncbi:unnamed protein product [Symbiodinium natans]|uniref:Integrase catalytic domain-containing protein n=1 Tax=Symbiodinium natans TaxID=878477 RepID=A0A812RK03_9DINO|nr:unnamed protein product [Symbiodinium natans]
MATHGFFDDDLYDFGAAAHEDPDGADSAELSDRNPGSVELGDDGAGSRLESANGSASSSTTRRRRRGQRGGKGGLGDAGPEKKWRSGAIPTAPAFDGDVEANPYCLRLYRRKLMRWVRLTKEYLPASEQALRALEQLRGDAELEFEEIDDSRFDHPDGISRLLQDLEVSFGERELFRQGGVIREFESIGRMQGESITAYIRRFRLLERKLAENKVPVYPEAARVVKLLDGLRLDEKATSTVLLAAGNKYDMKAVLEALRIQYPPGMSVTGVPKGLATLAIRTSRSTSSRASSFKSSSTATSSRRSRASKGSRWTQWQTGWEDALPEEPAVDIDFEEDEPENYLTNEIDYVEEPNEEPEVLDEAEEELVPEYPDYQEADESFEPEPSKDMNALLAAAEALTVTSKRLASLVQARGYYHVDGKSKGKSKSAGAEKKGKGKGGHMGAKSGGKSGKGTRKGMGKQGGKGSGDKQARLRGSLCLGCGAADHWVRDCPHMSSYQAQLASADLELDPEGSPVHCWMTSASLELPAHSRENCQAEPVYHVPRPPSIMLSTCMDASYLIADTGCQRQVAGVKWHEQRVHEILPLQRESHAEVCKFSFGPADGLPSLGRHLYPAGIAGELVALGISEIDSAAPGLLSRPTMEALGAVPDLLEGKVFFRALGGRSTRLYLSPCRHLALKIDEWPEHSVDWTNMLEQVTCSAHGPPDVYHKNMFPPELVHTTQQAVLYYSAASLKPRLKDKILEMFMEPCTAVTMMTTQAAMAAAAHLQLNKYPKEPDKCSHPQGTRNYSAAGTRIQICDVCGSRWVIMANGSTVEATPKANPNARTPLDLSDAAKQRIKDSKKATAKGKAAGGTPSSGSLSQPSSGYSRVSSLVSPRLQAPPPPRPSTAMQQAAGQTRSQIPKAYRMNGQPPRRLLYPQDQRSMISEPDTQDDGLSDNMSVINPSEGEGSRQRVRQWQRGNLGNRGRGLPLRQAQPPPLENPNDQDWTEADEAQEAAEFHDYMMARNHDPNYWEEMMDRECFMIKRGTRKRLSGMARSLWQDWQAEAKVYMSRAQKCRSLRKHKVDVVEVYGGHAAITEFAIKEGLRVLQPVDQIYGHALNSMADFDWLEKTLERWLPVLVIWEISCTAWTSLQHLSRSAEEIEALRALQRRAINSMVRIIMKLQSMGVHFLIENPYGTAFWKQPGLLKLQALPGVEFRMGCMCEFGLCDGHGQLLKKPTGWLSDMPELLDELARPCSGQHEHGQCIGGNVAKKAQVYTNQLARACIRGLKQGLRRLGDERWNKNYLTESDLPGEPLVWTGDINHGDTPEDFELHWEPPGELKVDIYFLDINRHTESWQPLLREAEGRFKNITTNTITLKPSPFFEKVKSLVPWTLQRVQLSKAPKQRRLPDEVLMNGAKHRGAALWCNDDEIRLEAEEIKAIAHAPASKYEKPVRLAIYFYGVAPASSMNPSDDAQPEPPRQPAQPEQVDVSDRMLPHQPGYRDISFPGIDVPMWIQQVLRRLHCNLGHPPKEVLVRQLALANASETAIKGARHLRCEVCLRVAPPHQPRAVKAYQPKRFNDRVCLDIVYIKDICKKVHMYLNCVDDATSYQAASYIHDRTEDTIIRSLLNGWFTFFGPPDEMAVDAEGAFRGMKFEMLHAQMNVDIRCIPPDAHWQLGKAERHGQALKWNAARLVSQFAASTVPEVNVCVAMATHAKNTLIRRSGSSPCQWVFGRNPKLPASLLSDGGSIESCQLTADSDRLQQIEAVRTQAMMNHHQFEAHAALRAALLRKSRPYRGQLFPGQKVAYYRLRSTQFDGEGSTEGYRQGIVLALDRNPSSNVAVNVWLRNSRGRVVQCAPEQVRPVFGEQEWWTPDGQDLEVLKNVDQAFPVLDADGRPTEPAMLNPVLMLPPTPAPSTPVSLALLQIVHIYPINVLNQVLLVSLALIQIVHIYPINVPNLVLHMWASGSGLTQELERLMTEEYPELRGLKRQPDIPTSELDAHVKSAPAQPTGPFPEGQEILLTFCQQCGDQHRVRQGGLSVCARCSCGDFVDSPKDVVSWYDEIQEREAFDKILVPGGKTKGPGGAPEHSSPDSLPQTLSSEDAGYDNLFFEQFSCKPVRNSMHRLEVLRRHGREATLRSGWDGSPEEVQAAYVQNAFLTAAHHFGDHDQDETTSAKKEGETTAWTTTTSSTPTTLTERLASQMLEQGDFSHQTCHQILDTLEFKRKTTTTRQAMETEAEDSGTLLLGLYSYGANVGLTNATAHYRKLAQYLAAYLKNHGMSSGVTSIQVTKNAVAKPHKDVNNAAGSLNWHVSLGNYRGGKLWVESSSQKFHDDPRTVQRDIEGQLRRGYLTDVRQRLISFDPKCFHFTEDYQGERYGITAFHTRLYAQATSGDRARLAQLGFPRPIPNRTWLSEPAFSAYPVKLQSEAADEGETLLAMESSAEEGDDGTFETRRAAKQARKKEVPWQSMTPEEVPEFVRALQQEWSEWERWSSCKPVWVRAGEVAAHLILRSRVCYRWKPTADGGQKPKARIVVLGFRDPHLPWLARDAPVLSRTAFHLILQWAASHQVKLHNADCKSAFLQGDPDVERPENIYMRPPQDPVAQEANPDWQDSRLLYRLTAPVYGQANAPRQWYEHVVRILQALGWVRHTLDPCLFLWKQDGYVVAVLGIHVDDLIAGALKDHEKTLKDVEKSFTWGSPWTDSDFVFVGRHIKQWPDGSITVDQASYVSEVPTTKVKLEDDVKLSGHPALVTEFRSGIGSLQWLAGTTRGDIAADVSLIQRSPADLCVSDLKEVNGVLRYVRATSDAYFKVVPLSFADLILVCYGDSGWANAPGHKSQGGLVITATTKKALTQRQDASLLEWKSYRHQRVLRSTLAAEAASLDKAYDHGHYMAMMLSEMMDGRFLATMNERPLCEVVPVTDARSLWDSIHRLSTNFQEKRVEIDVAALRQTCKGLRWVPTESQMADALTKRSKSLRDQFRQWMASPFVTLVDSKQPSDVVTGADANKAWRN